MKLEEYDVCIRLSYVPIGNPGVPVSEIITDLDTPIIKFYRDKSRLLDRFFIIYNNFVLFDVYFYTNTVGTLEYSAVVTETLTFKDVIRNLKDAALNKSEDLAKRSTLYADLANRYV